MKSLVTSSLSLPLEKLSIPLPRRLLVVEEVEKLVVEAMLDEAMEVENMVVGAMLVEEAEAMVEEKAMSRTREEVQLLPSILIKWFL